MMKAFTKASVVCRVFVCVWLSFALTAVSFCAEQNLSLEDKEQLEVQSDLFWLTWILWGMVIGLLGFAYSIRYIAKRSTRPCHWCMEFVSRKAAVCPRCGKPVEGSPVGAHAPKPT